KQKKEWLIKPNLTQKILRKKRFFLEKFRDRGSLDSLGAIPDAPYSIIENLFIIFPVDILCQKTA
ncbi:MAG: hypothetical protein AAB527_01395, partial [Patescibacteria group bacterium]